MWNGVNFCALQQIVFGPFEQVLSFSKHPGILQNYFILFLLILFFLRFLLFCFKLNLAHWFRFPESLVCD